MAFELTVEAGEELAAMTPSRVLATVERRQALRPVRLGTAVVCALGVHAIPVVLFLLGQLAFPQPPAVTDVPIAVELVSLQAPPQPESETPEGPKQVEAAASKLTPKPIERIIPQDVPSDVEPLPIPPQTPVTPTADSTPAPETTAPAAKPAPPAQVASSAPQTWQTQILGRIEKYKRYPSAARGQQGVVYVRFSIDREGRVLKSTIERSSGSGALDRAALDTLRRASPFPKPPAEITGNPIELNLAIDFFIK